MASVTLSWAIWVWSVIGSFLKSSWNICISNLCSSLIERWMMSFFLVSQSDVNFITTGWWSVLNDLSVLTVKLHSINSLSSIIKSRIPPLICVWSLTSCFTFYIFKISWNFWQFKVSCDFQSILKSPQSIKHPFSVNIG